MNVRHCLSYLHHDGMPHVWNSCAIQESCRMSTSQLLPLRDMMCPLSCPRFFGHGPSSPENQPPPETPADKWYHTANIALNADTFTDGKSAECCLYRRINFPFSGTDGLTNRNRHETDRTTTVVDNSRDLGKYPRAPENSTLA